MTTHDHEPTEHFDDLTDQEVITAAMLGAQALGYLDARLLVDQDGVVVEPSEETP